MEKAHPVVVVQVLLPDEEGNLVKSPRVVSRAATGSLLADGSRFLVGVPLAVAINNRSLGEEQTYLVVSEKAAIDSKLRKAAEKKLNDFENEVADSGVSQALPLLKKFLEGLVRSVEDRNITTLMFQHWVGAARPFYFRENQEHLHEAFFGHVVSLANKTPLLSYDDALDTVAEAMREESNIVRLKVQNMFVTALAGVSSPVNVVPDSQLRSVDLPGLRSQQDLLLAYTLIVMGLFSGLTELAILALAIDLCVGYFQFLHEVHLAERDGIITDEERTATTLAFGFILVPVLPIASGELKFANELARAAKSPVSAVREAVERVLETLNRTLLRGTIVVLLLGLGKTLLDIYSRQERLREAREAGFAGVEEVNNGSTIVLPLSALV